MKFDSAGCFSSTTSERGPEFVLFAVWQRGRGFVPNEDDFLMEIVARLLEREVVAEAGPRPALPVIPQPSLLRSIAQVSARESVRSPRQTRVRPG